MTPAECIADLDEMLADFGEDITLRRGAVDLELRAHAKTVKATELTSGVMLGDLKAAISATGLDNASWVAAVSAGTAPFNPDRRIPRKGEKAIVQGRLRNIENVMPHFVDGTLVRVDMVLRG